ncbi:MAG: hypothetical protein AB7O38_24445 [Pirellulaceae bacterium]
MTPARFVAAFALLICTVTCCFADHITEWGSNELGTDYDVSQDLGTVTILQGGGRHYKFYSETNLGSHIPGVINNITIDPGATGNILITIRGDGVNGPTLYGASQLSASDLRYGPGASDVCTLKACYIGGGVATADTVYIDLLDGPFHSALISGDVVIQGVNAPTGPGDELGITIDGDLSGSLTIDGHANRAISIFGDVSGSLSVLGDLNRSLRVTGAVPASGQIIFDGDITDAASTVYATGVYIRQMDGGYFECNNMAARATAGEQTACGADAGFYLYPHCPCCCPSINDGCSLQGSCIAGGYCTDFNLLQTGTVVICGVLSGKFYSRSKTAINMYIGSIEGEPDTEAGIGVGGIYTQGGFVSGFSLDVTGDFLKGKIACVGPASAADAHPLSGSVHIGGNMGSATARAQILAQYAGSVPLDASIQIDGALTSGPPNAGSEGEPAIKATGDLGGHIYINGGLVSGNGTTDTPPVDIPEIEIGGALSTSSAVVVDYDGYDALDDWQSPATVRIGSSVYYGNAPAARVYRITSCRGDMNNDGVVNSDDGSVSVPTSPYVVARDTPALYAAQFPGLYGSRTYHGNCNQDLNPDLTDRFDSYDDDPFERLKTIPCCIASCEDGDCPTDLDKNGDTGLPDLSILLSNFGLLASESLFPCADIDGDGDIDVQDLAVLLSQFGQPCPSPCPPGNGFTGGGEPVEAAYSIASQDFGAPELHAFCAMRPNGVELEMTLVLPNPGDDWTVAGFRAATLNGAAFVDGVSPDDAQEGESRIFGVTDSIVIAGAFDPSAANAVWTTSELNISWLDVVVANPGEFTLARAVIRIEDVQCGSDWGAAQPYFSETGPDAPNDVGIAEIRLLAGSVDLGGAFVKIDGAIYLSVP